MTDLKQLQEQIDNCRNTANVMLTLIRMYQKQDDRQESIRNCALMGKSALLKARELEQILENELSNITIELKLAA